MNYLKQNIWTISALAIIALLAMVDPAAAAKGEESATSSTLMEIAQKKAANTFQNVKSIIFIVGGFGLVLLAFGAIFGKIKWSAFASLAVGLAILAAAGAIVEYATGASGFQANAGHGLGDTFQRSAN